MLQLFCLTTRWGVNLTYSRIKLIPPLMTSLTKPIQVRDSADYMRHKREILYRDKYRQTKITIPRSLVNRLKQLKTVYNLRGLDAVCNAMLNKAYINYSPVDLTLPPPPPEGDAAHQIAIHIKVEYHSFIEEVAHHFRGISLGVAFETIAAQINDLEPTPVQLSFIQGEPQ